MVALLLLTLVGCGGKEVANMAEEEAGDMPQIASLEDYGLPVDKSDQITAIDAATGDAGGMPRDGGSVIAPPKQERRPAVASQEAATTTMAIPEAAAPPPPATTPLPTIPAGN